LVHSAVDGGEVTPLEALDFSPPGRTLRSIRSHPCASGLALRPKRLFGFDGTADEDPRFSTGLLSLRGLGPSSATATALLSPAVLIKLQGAPSLGRRRELVRPHAE